LQIRWFLTTKEGFSLFAWVTQDTDLRFLMTQKPARVWANGGLAAICGPLDIDSYNHAVDMISNWTHDPQIYP
jgi:hypothetical protein